MIWDAAQAPPPFSGQVPWTFNVVEGVERISAYGDEALQYARDNHPDEPGWEWTDRPGFQVFWGAPALIIISGRVEDCCRAGRCLMLSAHARGPGHLLGGIADVVVDEPHPPKPRLRIPAGASAGIRHCVSAIRQ